MGCVIPHQSNAVNIPDQTNAGLTFIVSKQDLLFSNHSCG
jgi:hypothetical protein